MYYLVFSGYNCKIAYCTSRINSQRSLALIWRGGENRIEQKLISEDGLFCLKRHLFIAFS